MHLIEVCVAGGAIASMGVFFSIFSPNIYILVLTYGVVGGIGLSLVWMPTVTTPSYYFTKKRALATGKNSLPFGFSNINIKTAY